LCCCFVGQQNNTTATTIIYHHHHHLHILRTYRLTRGRVIACVYCRRSHMTCNDGTPNSSISEIAVISFPPFPVIWEVGRWKSSLGCVGTYKSNYTWCAYSSSLYTLREEEYWSPLPRRASRTKETKNRKFKHPRKKPGGSKLIAKGTPHPTSQWHVKFYRTSGRETLGFRLFSLTPSTPLTSV
jgi:hypothetical protein